MAAGVTSRRRALVVAFATAVSLAAATGVRTAAAPEKSQEQVGASIPFDHATHAGEYEIACLGCHVYADTSPNAGLPSVRMCMGCHKFVAKDKPAVQALAALFAQGEAPRWRSVTRMPDFIYFTHRMHLRKEVACTECHGEVKAMHVTVAAKNLTMGFCLDCHDKRNASGDCIACHK